MAVMPFIWFSTNALLDVLTSIGMPTFKLLSPFVCRGKIYYQCNGIGRYSITVLFFPSSIKWRSQLRKDNIFSVMFKGNDHFDLLHCDATVTYCFSVMIRGIYRLEDFYTTFLDGIGRKNCFRIWDSTIKCMLILDLRCLHFSSA